MNKKFKKSLCTVLACAMMITTATSALNVTAYADNTSASAKAGKSYTVKGKKANIYYFSGDLKETSSVYFVNGTDIPYIEISDAVGMINKVMGWLEFDKYKLDLKKEGNKVTITRENGYYCIINFDKDTIYFKDYNAFGMLNSDHSIMELALLKTKDENGKGIYIKRIPDDTNERYGSTITMDLAKYNIDIVRKGSKYYIPIQTFSDVFLWKVNFSLLYNGKTLFLTNCDGLLDSNYKRTALGKIYFKESVKKKTISKELTEYNYNELCFALDNNYGLKEIHNIDDFDSLMSNTGMKKLMLSGDAESIDTAIYVLATRYIDDVHTKYGMPSPATGYKFKEEIIKDSGEGLSRDAFFAQSKAFKEAKSKYFPDGAPVYEEIGDTAFITFDSFVSMDGSVDYYKTPPTAEASDTIGKIAYSVQQILRKDSPVKNVVLDLSCNGGGSVEAAIYTIGAFLGKASLSFEDSFTGALVTDSYAVDTNFDHKFDSNDYLAGKGLNLYCIESGISFSSGNLVPSVFKHTSDVSIIGETSGGGSCSVIWVTTATGASIRISSPTRMSFMKNGAFYNVDLGAEPDIYLSKKDSYFDRKKLVEYINNLM